MGIDRHLKDPDLIRSLPKSKLPSPARPFARDPGAPSVGESLGAEIRSRRRLRSEERISFYEWSLRVPEPKAGKLDFKRFPFQLELYGESARDKEVVIQKSTQVGVSAWMLRWAMYWADMRGLTALYVFPKLKQMYDFSDARIRAAILKSEFLQQRIPNASVQNKGLKQVGGGFVYFRGSESEDDLDSVDADVLALDEYNRLVPANIPVAERRISGSQLALLRRVGVPTSPGFGISRLYNQSDQRRWYVKCPGCSEDQFLTWTDNVDSERGVRKCRKCERELGAEEVAAGRWVAENPDSDVRGYSIPKIITPQVNMRSLIEASERKLPEERQAFWNRDMAEPFAPAEGKLSPQAIQAAQSAGAREGVALQDGYWGTNVVTMGVDVASRRQLNVRISEHIEGRRKKALWIGEVDDFDEIGAMMDRYRVSMCCIDHMPESRAALKVADDFPGRVYLVRLTGGHMHKVISVDDGNRTVSVRRTDAIDAMMEGIRSQRNLLPEALPAGYADQLMAPTRIVEKDDKGRVTVSFESPGRDDYAFAEVFDLIAREAWWHRQAVAEAEADHFTTLDDHMDWERSALGEDEEIIYRAGPEASVPEDSAYVAGFGE